MIYRVIEQGVFPWIEERAWLVARRTAAGHGGWVDGPRRMSGWAAADGPRWMGRSGWIAAGSVFSSSSTNSYELRKRGKAMERQTKGEGGVCVFKSDRVYAVSCALGSSVTFSQRPGDVSNLSLFVEELQ